MSPELTPVLVTGGAGYIGSHTCKALRKAGYLPVTIDNLCRGNKEAVKWGSLHVGELGDTDLVQSLLKRYQPEAVIHFAGLAYVAESVENPSEYYFANPATTLFLLETMRLCGIKKFIYSSSCATYGDPKTDLIEEGELQAPVSPYGRSKLMAEWMIKDFCDAYGFSATILRYFNAAGADPDGEIGEDHNPEPHLIPNVVSVALGKSPYVPVYGRGYDTLDGTPIRDFVHVSDLADAHVLALQKTLGTPGYTELNLGQSRGLSVLEIIDAAIECFHKDINFRVQEPRPGDPAVLIASNEKAKAVLGWEPKLGLKAILKTAYAWQEKK